MSFGAVDAARFGESRLRTLCRRALPPAVLVVLVLSVIRTAQPLPGQYGDKIEHALAFFVLAALAGIGHAGSALASRLMIALIGCGLLIECIQWCIPWREFSLLDWAADAMGVLCWLLLAWLRRRVMR